MAGLITIFGGSGFVGRYVVQELAKTGVRIRVATRDPHRAAHVRPLAALGQLDFARVDYARHTSIARAVDGADGVINLIGVLSDGGAGGAFKAVHIVAAGAIAEAAANAGVKSVVQISAIGADPASPSAYGRSKGDGETAVKAAFPDATIMRPSIIFGPEDNFLNRFAGLMRMLPVMPVFAPGTQFQPVYVVDVARAIVAAVTQPKTSHGKTYTLGGPEIISMRALLEWIASAIDRTPQFADVPDPVAALLARLTGWLPGAPITSDQWLMLQSGNIVPDGATGLSALDIDPVPMAAVAPNWLVRFKKHGRFEKRGDKAA